MPYDAKLRPLPLMLLFFLSMAFLESAVVVYLRALYYPDGFEFPIVPMDQGLVTTELWREVATMLMLLAPGALVTKSALERFAWFCFGFGVWDLGYYLWLKVLLDWPATWGTWDLLFLVPVPWVGPVWAPCTIALGLIILAIHILHMRGTGRIIRITRKAWTFLILGALLMITSFVMDPLSQGFVGIDRSITDGIQKDTIDLTTTAGRYIPGRFPWRWFAAGWLVALMGMGIIIREGLKSRFRMP